MNTNSIANNNREASSNNAYYSPTTKKRKTFSLDEEEKIIIAHYEQNEFLWNPKHPNYKIGSKSLCMVDLVNELNNKFTASEIHNRFSGMRSTYRQKCGKNYCNVRHWIRQCLRSYLATFWQYEVFGLHCTCPSISIIVYNIKNETSTLFEDLEYLEESEDILIDGSLIH